MHLSVQIREWLQTDRKVFGYSMCMSPVDLLVSAIWQSLLICPSGGRDLSYCYGSQRRGKGEVGSFSPMTHSFSSSNSLEFERPEQK